MSLDISEWKPFLIGRIFTVKYGVNLELDSLNETSEEGCVNFVSRCISNNGVSAKVEPISGIEPQAAGIISVAGGGSSVLSTYVQEEPFYSGRDLYLLIPKIDLSKETKLFITTVIEKNKYRYSFGRQANKTLEFLEILLPVKRCDGAPVFDNKKEYSDDGYIPDWQFMEDYIKSLHHKPLTTNNAKSSPKGFDTANWKEFRVGNLFDIHPTKSVDGVSADNCVGYGTPLVVNSAENNGVAGLCDIDSTENGNIITFSDTTDGNTFFYQPSPFIGFAHVQGMYPKNKRINRAIMLFICTMLMFDSRGRYSYGRKMRRDTISEIMLKLPVDKNGNPDWDYMENYIKSLPYGDRI